MAESDECPALDFGSGHDPKALSLSPVSGLVLGMEPTRDSFSLSLCPA